MRTTGLQVSGVGFLLRRLELALVIGDPRMAHDPLRSQRRAIAVGVLLSLLIAGGAVMLALLRPQPAVNETALAQDEAGGLYVRLGEAFHPVTNVASARLVTRQPVQPTRTTFQQIQKFPHGPAIGVPAAPELTQGPSGTWMVCDDGRVVVAPEARTFKAGVLRAPSGVWLVKGTERAKVDGQTARLLGVTENKVSDQVIQQFDRLPDITAVSLKTNHPTGLPKPFDRTGRLLEADGRVFLTQHGGLLELTGLRRTYAEAIIGTAPQVTTLADILAQPSVQPGPRTLGILPGESVDFAPAGYLCAGQDGLSQPVESFGSLFDAPTPRFTGPRGTSVIRTERGLAVVSETGVRYPVGSHADLQALGFRDPVYVPWRVVAGLPDGGLLSEDNARATTAMITASARTAPNPTATR